MCHFTLKKKISLKEASKRLMVASAEVHSAEFGPWTTKLKVFLA